MTTTVGATTSYPLTIPELSETADIQTAIKLIAYGTSSNPANDAAILANSISGYIATKANIAGPTFTGTVVLPSTTSIGTITSTELGYLDGVTSAIQTQFGTKANLAGPTFTGTVVLPSTTSIGNVSSTEISYLDGVTSAIQTQIGTKANLAGPTFTGTVVLPSTTSIGTVTSTEIGYLDGVTSAIQTQIDNLVAGTGTYQPLDTDLTAIAGLTSAADRLPYFTGSGTAALATFTTFGRSLVDDADAATARTTLGLGTMAVATASDYLTTSSASSTYLTQANASSTYQLKDADLTALAGLTSAANALPYFTGSGTASTTTLSAFGRTLIDDADAATARTTLGLGTMAVETASNYLTTSSASTTYAPILDPIFTGTVTVPSGTTAKAPLKFNTGTTKLTTIQPGTVEYDGNIFYATPKVNNSTAGRGLVPSEQVIVLDANYTPSTLTGTPNETIAVSNSAFNKSIYLAASQAYFVDMSIIVYHNLITLSGGSSSVTFSMSAPTSSTCHITGLSTLDAAAITGGTATLEFFTGNISGNSENVKTIASSTSDTGYSILKWSGVIYIGTTAGNFAPQLTRSVTSGASASSAQIIVQAGSYCKVTPLGTYASQINIGGWA